ncbi:uncharacterized protein LOC142345948 [Convolutriloba macropyga]|uniref:uncharacterized protein LOC142345948 n=1 Tax=Convolutriloba macropyga TaxID=536237 RepID=UPI003F524F2F
MDLDNEQFNITDTAPEPESDNFPWVEATQIASIAGLVITILGFLLNYFCFITAGQLPESSSARLMKYLAVWDSISSMQDGVFNLGLKAFGVNLASFTRVGCKLFYWHSWASSITASYHIVAMAVDRVLAIKAPFWHREHSSAKLVNKVTVFIAFFFYLFTLPVLYFYDIVPKEDSKCLADWDNYPKFFGYYGMATNYAVFSGIPFVILLGANWVFISALINKPSVEKPKAENGNQRNVTEARTKVKRRDDRKERNKRSYVIMLMFLTGSYLVFSATTAANNITAIQSFGKVSADQSAFRMIITEITLILNNSVNFLFYFMSGSVFRSAFKSAILNLFGKKSPAEKNNQSVTGTTATNR